MSSSPLQLSPEMLDRYLAALRAAGAPLADNLGPGLSDQEIDELLAPLGLAASPELRTLWGWRITSMASAPQPDAFDLNPDFELWPPEIAVKQTENYRDHTDGGHRPSVAVAGAKWEWLLVLCDPNSAAATAPIEHFLLDEPTFATRAPSLGALFAKWTEQLERGDYTHTSGEWEPENPPQTLIVD